MSMQGGSNGRRLFPRSALGCSSAAVPALWACTSRSLEPPAVTPDVTGRKRFPQTINRDVDLLFLIDDSMSMKKSQANLLRNFPRSCRALEGFEGGLPNVHIAVISSDMGDGGVTQCVAAKGESSSSAPRGGCATDQPAGRRALHLECRGSRQLHRQPCRHLHVHRRAGRNRLRLRAAVHRDYPRARRRWAGRSRPRIKGFLRDDAYLAIVMITNEDDCSTAVGGGFYGPQSLPSQLGTAFRCNEFGHICDGGPRADTRPTTPLRTR